MDASVAKAYSEMKKSQEADPKKVSRKEPKLTLVGKDDNKPAKTSVTTEEKPKVSSTRNIAEEMQKMTDVPAMEVIRHFTDLFQINVFSFLAILKKTMLYNNGFSAIEYVDENNLNITANREKYELTFKKRFGKFMPMFTVSHSDNLSETSQEYTYHVEVGEDKIPVVKLVSVIRENDDFHLYGGGQDFKLHVCKEDVEYEVMINCERIRNNPALVENYIRILSELNSHDANLIYKELLSRFKITENEHHIIKHSQVMVSQDCKVISMVRYYHGKLESVFVRDHGNAITVRRNGTWSYTDVADRETLKYENGVEEFHSTVIGGKASSSMNEIKKKIASVQQEFFGENA